MSITISADHLAAIAGRSTALMPALAEWINRLCPEYGIDSAPEFCHFLAQACHETDHFKTLREYASGQAYEGRADLGNTQPGDGPRFRGRGIFQTTGRANYQQLGAKKGAPQMFLDRPELLEQAEFAVWSACEYWRTRGLGDISNHPDSDVLKKKYKGAVLDLSPVEYISYTVNGGNRGLEDRKKFYAIAQRLLMAEAVPAGARGMRAMPVAPPTGKKAAAKKAAGKKAPATRKATAKTAAPKRAAGKKAATKSAAPKKSAAKKAAPRRAASKQAVRRRSG